MTTRKFYKKIITIEVISQDEPFDYSSIEEIGWAVVSGEHSGSIIKEVDVELNGKEVVVALIDQNSDPEFFGLDSDGNDLY